MKPYQTNKGSEHLAAFQFFFGRIIVLGYVFPPSPPWQQEKVTLNCLALM
jgi:hypothetical protein